jgi:hypothetical protein
MYKIIVATVVATVLCLPAAAQHQSEIRNGQAEIANAPLQLQSRIVQKARLDTPWGAVRPISSLTREKISAVQQALNKKGFNPGRLDGRWAPTSRIVLLDFQKSHGLAPSGELDRQTVMALGMRASEFGFARGGSPYTTGQASRPTAADR